MSSQLASLRSELKEFEEQLDKVRSSLESDPDNEELQTLKSELEEFVSYTQEQINELQPAAAASLPEPKEKTPPPREKWSKEDHPAFQAGYRSKNQSSGAPDPTSPPEERAGPAIYKVNDTVLARWISGDKSFYPARITSKTGSAAAPIYHVTFKSYNNTETLRGADIKPIAPDSKKRRWGAGDEPPAVAATTASPTVTSQSGSGAIISAAADINPELATQASAEPSKVSDGPARPPKMPRKVKANKELEAGKSKWQDFTAKSKHGKAGKKDSMFRTGEGVNARVGFTGSGQAMRKDQTRSRHIYQPQDDDY